MIQRTSFDFWNDLDHHPDYKKGVFEQYGGNELSCPRRSAVSECGF